MSFASDLSADALEALLAPRAVRSQPVLLSTASSGAEWARAAAPDGAVVVAEQQIAPRGRAGRPWKVAPGRDLAFALVLRPQLPTEREGFLYTLVLAALADVCGPDVTIEWPDEIRRDDVMVAAAGIETRLGARGVKWAVVNFLLPDAEPPRAELLRAILEAVDVRRAAEPGAVAEEHRRLCATVGRKIRARLLGGAARLEGTAVDTLDDGSLLLQTGEGRSVPVRPQDISIIADA